MKPYEHLLWHILHNGTIKENRIRAGVIAGTEEMGELYKDAMRYRYLAAQDSCDLLAETTGKKELDQRIDQCMMRLKMNKIEAALCCEKSAVKSGGLWDDSLEEMYQVAMKELLQLREDAERWREVQKNPFAACDALLYRCNVQGNGVNWSEQSNLAMDKRRMI